jgi:aminobenzoyl-glutamate utilization protein B
VASQIDSQAAQYKSLAKDIWGWAEMGYLEQRSSGALQEALRQAGFSIESGVADIPTAFIASYGRGAPVIALLAEFDALPGMSQQAIGERQPIEGAEGGHACGHHLFGTASVAAAISIRQWLAANGGKGSVRVYGTPAEEGGSGKVYMVRDGLFDDVDTVLHWHPSDRNFAGNSTTLANRSAKFRFQGAASHAAAAPERGRSALDGVEAMNHMVNQLREHVPSDTRIHYVITDGGDVPNIVPAQAEVYYYVRSPSAASLERIWERVEKAAEGAALGTGTQVEREIIHGNHSILPNIQLSAVMHASLESFGGIEYGPREQEFAQQIYATFPAGVTKALGDEKTIVPYSEEVHKRMGSSDVGDVSWVVPTAGLNTATWVPGTSTHSWQAVAAGGNEVGMQGMLLAAKTLARTGIELLNNPEVVAEAKVEFNERRGENYEYKPILGDRPPPLDYRK